MRGVQRTRGCRQARDFILSETESHRRVFSKRQCGLASRKKGHSGGCVEDRLWEGRAEAVRQQWKNPQQGGRQLSPGGW